MFKLLVVEDQVDFYEGYLSRIFEKTLPMDKIIMVHVPTLDTAIVALQEHWNFILMDYSLGAKINFLGDPVRDGADLVSFRRAIEKADDGCGGIPRAYILGISSNQVGNILMNERGADDGVLKLQIPHMADYIQGALKKSE